MRPDASRSRRYRRYGLRLAISLALLGGLLAWLPLDRLGAALRRVAPVDFAVVLGFALAGHAIGALKWRIVLGSAGVRIGVREILRAHAGGLFANLWLPSVAGGELVRTGLVLGQGRSTEGLLLGAVVDRGFDTAALLALCALGLLIDPAGSSASALRAAGAVASLVAAAAVMIGWGLPAVPLGRLPTRLREPVRAAQRAGMALRGRPAALLGAFALALAVQGGFVLLNAWIGAMVGIAIPLGGWLFAWPLAKIAALLPVSVGGLGVREAALAGLLTRFGVEPARAVAQSLVWEALLLALALTGGMAAVLLRTAPASPPAGRSAETLR